MLHSSFGAYHYVGGLNFYFICYGPRELYLQTEHTILFQVLFLDVSLSCVVRYLAIFYNPYKILTSFISEIVICHKLTSKFGVI